MTKCPVQIPTHRTTQKTRITLRRNRHLERKNLREMLSYRLGGEEKETNMHLLFPTRPLRSCTER